MSKRQKKENATKNFQKSFFPKCCLLNFFPFFVGKCCVYVCVCRRLFPFPPLAYASSSSFFLRILFSYSSSPSPSSSPLSCVGNRPTYVRGFLLCPKRKRKEGGYVYIFFFLSSFPEDKKITIMHFSRPEETALQQLCSHSEKKEVWYLGRRCLWKRKRKRKRRGASVDEGFFYPFFLFLFSLSYLRAAAACGGVNNPEGGDETQQLIPRKRKKVEEKIRMKNDLAALYTFLLFFSFSFFCANK